MMVMRSIIIHGGKNFCLKGDVIYGARYVCLQSTEKDVRGDFKFKRSKNVIEIDYWRKHHDLHGWFENLYLSKGGNETFNCIPLKLELEDLDQLEYDIKIEIYHILQVFLWR